MDWTDLIATLGDRARAEPASAFRADGPYADLFGVYGWWADETAGHLIEETLDTDATSLIYVGKAGGSSSVQTFATRVLGKHLCGSDRTSTLRQSLTAILMADPAFAATRPDPRARATRDIVSDWMREHLEVAVVAVDRQELVKDAERAAVVCYDPPLNLRGVARTPARARLSELRAALRRQVRHARDSGTVAPLQ